MQQELTNHLIATYGNAPKTYKTNGVTRFNPAGKSTNDKCCWVRYYGAYAFYGNWSDGNEVLLWRSEEQNKIINSMNKYQQEAYYKSLDSVRADILAKEQAEKQAKFAKFLNKVKGSKAYNNSYFIRKKVNVRDDFMMDGNCVVVPLYDMTGAIVGVQNIVNDFKWIGEGSEKKGAFYPIRDEVKMRDADILFIVEGVATGLSAYEMVGEYSDSFTFQVICAMDCGNIPVVVEEIRKYYPNKIIIGLADNDSAGENAMLDAKIPYIVWSYGCKGFDVNDAWLSDKMVALQWFNRKMLALDEYFWSVA